MADKKTILIVEDEEALLNAMRDILQNNKFSTIEAKDGQAGVSLALAAHPDLILLDLMLPGMDGMTALKKIRADDWGKHVPVIILTNLSATDEHLVGDMVKQNPSYYLIKSDWKLKDIVEKIKKILKA